MHLQDIWIRDDVALLLVILLFVLLVEDLVLVEWSHPWLRHLAGQLDQLLGLGELTIGSFFHFFEIYGIF